MEFTSFINYVTLFFLQYVLNGLIYILAGYALSKNPINFKKYFLSSIILAILGFTAKILSETRLLNTSNTIPQILILFTCIFLLVNINKIQIVRAIISSLIIMILQVFLEGIYVLIVLKSIIGINIDKIYEGPLYKTSIIGLPILIILGISVLLYYKAMMKRRIQ